MITVPSQLSPNFDMTGVSIKMASNPLDSLLQHTNYLFATHAPPLVSFCPTHKTNVSRVKFRVGCWTSQDIQAGRSTMRYKVQCRIRSTFNDDMTIIVQAGVGGGASPTWSTVHTAAHILCVGSIPDWDVVEFNIELSDYVSELTFDFDAGSNSKFLISHVLVVPNPNTASPPFVSPFTRLDSGFAIYDDGMLTPGTGNRPVNTELVDRCRINCQSVWKDRTHMVLSFVQEDGEARDPQFLIPDDPAHTQKPGWYLIGTARAFVPYESNFTVTLLVLGSTDGTPDNRIKVTADTSQNGPIFDADGSMQYGSLECFGSGKLGTKVQFRIWARHGADDTKIHSIVGIWKPTVGYQPLCGGQVSPAAKLGLMRATIAEVFGEPWKGTFGATTRPYAQPALIFNGSGTLNYNDPDHPEKFVRRIGLSVSPGRLYARLHVSQCYIPGQGTPRKFMAGSESSGGYSSPYLLETQLTGGAQSFWEFQYDYTSEGQVNEIVVTSATVDDTPDAGQNRALRIYPSEGSGLMPGIEEIQVQECNGLGVEVIEIHILDA